MFKRTVNRLEAAFTIGNISIQIRCHPIDGADDLVRFEVNPLDDSEMKDANTSLAFTLHSFDGNSILWLYLGRPPRLVPILPTKHPHAFIDKALILVVFATPRCSYDPVICHVIFLVNANGLRLSAKRRPLQPFVR